MYHSKTSKYCIKPVLKNEKYDEYSTKSKDKFDGSLNVKVSYFFLSFKIFPNNPPALTVFSLDKQGSIAIRNYAPFVS